MRTMWFLSLEVPVAAAAQALATRARMDAGLAPALASRPPGSARFESD